MSDLSGITSNRWHEFHKRRRSPFFTAVFLGGTGFKSPDLPFDNRIKNFGYFSEHIAVSESEKEGLREKSVAHLRKDPEYLLRFMEHAYKQHQAAIVRWKNGSSADYKSAFTKYIQDLQGFGQYVSLPLFIEDYLEGEIKKRFQEKFGSEADTWFHIAVDPVKNGTVLEEEIDRLKLGATDDLSSHVSKYSWMANTGFFEEYYTADHYHALIAEEKDPKARLSEITSARALHQKKFLELHTLLQDDEYLAVLVKTANEAVYFRSYRTEMYYSSPIYNQELFPQVGQALGLSDYRNFVWLYPNEILYLLKEGVAAPSDLIATRKNGYAYLSDYDGSYTSWDGDDAQRVLGAYMRPAVQSEGDELKGQAAFRGTVTGRALVLKDATEIHRVTNGEILVTHATNVNFVPALRKVTGIVTEEGGILSHASIISRELRIPCVIGVKNATQMIKTGDHLELDAERGVVRILGNGA